MLTNRAFNSGMERLRTASLESTTKHEMMCNLRKARGKAIRMGMVLCLRSENASFNYVRRRVVHWGGGEIRTLYRLVRKVNRESRVKYEVDHIIPVTHNLVSGLHVPQNLRVVVKHENREKRNHFTPYFFYSVE